MEMLMLVCSFFIGLFIGSFLNVLIDRIPREENFFVGRSHCDFCKHPLSWYDLFPLFSFMLLKGKCRYCHTFIGWKYPLIELTTGIAFALIIWQQFSPAQLIFSLLAVSCLIVIFYTDLFSGIIPDGVLLFLLFTTIVDSFIDASYLPSLFSALGAGLFFLALFLLTKRKGIGFGDVKYAFVMGYLLPYPGIIIGLYIAFLTGAFVALILIVVRRKSFASSIAFGPFLVIGTLAVLFWEPQLWEIFRHIIGM